jgi:DNA-binding MarR family transcriptional regulator
MALRKRLRQEQFESVEQEAMVGLLVASGHLGQALEQVCAEHGITHDQYNVLRILRGASPEGHPRYEIADRLINRAPDVTRLLNRLEREGLVERYRSDVDRRLSFSRITGEGLGLLAEMEPSIRAVHHKMADALGSKELRDLARYCRALIQ